jgi:anti-sigma regulatory factor (Ser/Thr protein kinase)
MTELALDVPSVDELIVRGLYAQRPKSAPDVAVLPLPPRRESVKMARDFTDQTLRHWDLRGLCDELGLVVSELVTNAVIHAYPAYPAVAGGLSGVTGRAKDRSVVRRSVIHLGLLDAPRHVLCAVTDPSVSAPVPCEFDDSAESGRGLQLVSCYSADWGWRPLVVAGHPVGKVVWARFDLPA